MKILVQDYNKTERINVINLDRELEKAHENKLQNKLTSLFRLQQIEESENVPTIYRNWCRDIAEYIKENS